MGLTSVFGSSSSDYELNSSDCSVSEPDPCVSYDHVDSWLVTYQKPEGHPDWPSSGAWWVGPVDHQFSTFQTSWSDHNLNQGNGRNEHDHIVVLHRQSPEQSARLDALINSLCNWDPAQRGIIEDLHLEKFPPGMIWNLEFIRHNPHDIVLQLYCSDLERPSPGTQWYIGKWVLENSEWVLTPVEQSGLSLTFTSAAELRDQELAFRRVLDDNCYGLPRMVTHAGWIANPEEETWLER